MTFVDMLKQKSNIHVSESPKFHKIFTQENNFYLQAVYYLLSLANQSETFCFTSQPTPSDHFLIYNVGSKKRNQTNI